MINVYIPRFLSLFFSFSLLIGPLPLSAIIEDITISLSDWQANIVSNNPDESYVYQDFIFAERDTIIQILEYAAIVLQKKYNQLNNADTEQIIADLDEIIDTITNGSLTIFRSSGTIVVLSVTDEIISGSLTIIPFGTAGIVHNSALGNISSSLIVNADVSTSAAIVDTKLATIATAGKVSNSATTATSANTASAIVARDGSGNFSAGTITATLSGNATTATTATNFSGSLSGEVTGTQGATVVSNAVSANTASAIVRRTSAGGFSAGAISITDEAISSSLTITPFGTAGIVHNSAAGLLSSSLIVNVDVAAGAAIVDTKLATISTAGKVSNSATTATSVNTASAIVARDGSGNFSAGAISVTDEVISTSLTVTPFNTAGIVHNSAAGLLSSSLIVNADVSTSAAIVDTKLATIATAGKVSNSATTATSANTASAIVARDGSGNFSAGVISITDGILSGNLTLSSSSSSSVGNIFKGVSRFIHNFGTNNTFVGIGAGNFTLSGSGGNTGIGTVSLQSLTTGTSNTAVGVNSLSANTAGINNTAIGLQALLANTTGNNNVAVGIFALQANTTGISNVAIGDSTLTSNTIGTSNTAIGGNALQTNTTGINNTAIGLISLLSNTTGSFNTAVGNGALSAVTTGSTNIAIGSSAGGTLTTGSNNIYIGLSAASSSESNVTKIANIRGVTTVNNNAIAVLIDSAGQLGTVSSTRRVKHNIEDMNAESSNIYQLRPVTFAYNCDPSETKQYGLIAEETDEVFPGIVVCDADNQPETIQYHVLPVLLLNEMKKQQATIQQQQSAIDGLTITVESMNVAINTLREQIKEFVGQINSLKNCT